MTPTPAFAVDDINPFDGAGSVSTTEPVVTETGSSSGTEVKNVSDAAVTESKSEASTDLVAAVVEPEHITFVFDANTDDDVTGEMLDQDVVLNDKDWYLSENTFVRAGYKFVGWSTTIDGKNIKDDPKTDEDESFKAFPIVDKQRFNNLGYSYDVEQKDGTFKTINAELSEVVINNVVTLYAQWEKIPDLAEEKAVEIAEDVPEVVKEDLKEESAISEDKTDAANVTVDDESEDKNQKDVVTAEDDKKADTNSKMVITTDESESEPVIESEVTDVDVEAVVSHVETDGLMGVMVSGVDTEEEAQEALEKDGMEPKSAKRAAKVLFAEPLRAPESDTLPTSADGNTVESIDAVWITADTVDNDDVQLLYLRPTGDNKQEVRLRVSYSLSGEKDYGPGDVVITIPANLFVDRDGHNIGRLVIPYPEDPSVKATFNWKQVGNEIQLVNTKRLTAATHGFFDIAVTDLTPHVIKDMAVHDWTGATIEVTTANGNLIGLTSNTLSAQIDTEAKITSASKQREGTVDIVDVSSVPVEARVEGEEHYVRVRWYSWGFIAANQNSALTYVDTVADEYESKTARHVANDVHTVSGTVFFNEFKNGTSEYAHFNVYYPMSQFEPDIDYTFRNNITYTLTEQDAAVGDDPRLVTTQSASAQVIWNYHLPQFIIPTGHFMVYKMGNDGDTWANVEEAQHSNWEAHHFMNLPALDFNTKVTEDWYGVYPSALNNMRDGKDIEIAYTSRAVGYLLPWTLGEDMDTHLESSYGQRSVTMTVDEDGLTGLTPLVDYEWTGVDFGIRPSISKIKAINVNPDGSFAAMYAGDGTFEYQADNDATHIPQLTLSIKQNGVWQDYATVDYTSGLTHITVNGEHVPGTKVILPSGVEDIRVSATTNVAALTYWFRPMATLKADSPHVRAIVDYAFADNRIPSYSQYNQVTMTAERADTHEALVEITRRGYDALMGYNTDVRVVPHKSSYQTLGDIDFNEGVITIHYSADVEERTIISDLGTYKQALADGAILEETDVIWRDLLPIGVVPDTSTVELRSQDAIKRIYTIEDYNDTGRTLLVVEAKVKNTPVKYREGNLTYYEDRPSISFDAVYSFENVVNYGDVLHNIISFETENDYVGTVPNYRGEPDNPTAGNNIASSQAFIDDYERGAMTDLDSNSDGPKFVYAGCVTRLDLLGRGETSLTKEVDVNNEGVFTTGVYYGHPDEYPDGAARIVYEGGQYTYRLTMISNLGTTSKNMILYDSLENYEAHDGNDEVDIGAPHWKGTLRKVDVSQLEELGVNPIVYYCTNKTLVLEDSSDNEINSLETNPDIWIRADEYEGSLDDVGAIAVDLRKKKDGTDFELPEGESVVVLLQMRAPYGDEVRGYIDNDAHAYNNAFLKSTSVDNATLIADTKWIRKDYVKVGIKEMNLEVQKIWADDDDRDGFRPESVVVHLLEDNVDTGRSITITPDINGDWYGVFEHVPYTREDGTKAVYSFLEDVGDGYVPFLSMSGNKVRLTNAHEPEKTVVAGEKTWVADEDDSAVRPQSITVILCADGQETTYHIVRPNDKGNWTYSFEDLPKYRDHGVEINYTVKEMKSVATQDYISSYDGLNIVNTYHPYGNLEVSKTVKSATSVVADKEFTFTFRFLNTNNEPIFDEFNYTTNKGRSGTIATDGSLTLVDEEVATIEELPRGTRYEVVEAEEPGFITEAVSDTGIIVSNETSRASFKNTYTTTGSAQLVTYKRLTGKTLNKYQFRFEVYDVTGLDGEERETGGTLVRASTNAADGLVTFGRLNYSNNDNEKVYTYRIQETIGDRAGYVYDTHISFVDIEIFDNGDGTMNCRVVDDVLSTEYIPVSIADLFSDIDVYGCVGNEYMLLERADSGGGEDIVVGYRDGGVFTPYDTSLGIFKRVEFTGTTFVNRYEATGSLNLKAWKQLQGRKLVNNEFEFVLDEVDEHNQLVENGIHQVKHNNVDGEIIWDTLNFDQDDIGKTFYYRMTEVSGNDVTVNYDDSVLCYRVVVVDNGDGTLSFTQTSAEPIFEALVCPACHGVNSSGWLDLGYLGLYTGDSTSARMVNLFSDLLRDVEGSYSYITNTVDFYLGQYPGRASVFNEMIDLAQYLVGLHWSDAEWSDNIDHITDDYILHVSSGPAVAVYPTVYIAYECNICGGDGSTDGEAIVGWKVPDDIISPVFTNTLKDGSLRIEKRITDDSINYPEDQTFRYRIELGTPSTAGGDETVRAISHTVNIDDDGVAQFGHGNYWNNWNIVGTDRANPNNDAHVITIPGAERLHVNIKYGTDRVNYDWVCVWEGAHPNYTASSNHSSSLSGKLGGQYSEQEFDIEGDSVTFSFTSNAWNNDDSPYGYYAEVTAVVSTPVVPVGSVDIDMSNVTFEELTPVSGSGAE